MFRATATIAILPLAARSIMPRTKGQRRLIPFRIMISSVDAFLFFHAGQNLNCN
jgi:hypothetical protein